MAAPKLHDLEDMSVLTTEYLRLPMDLRKNGARINPTGLAVVMAFVARGVTPAGADWKAGDWETSPTPVVDVASTTFWARCLIGPGAGAVIALPAGKYVVWFKLTDNPEVPARPFATLKVV